MFPTRAHIHTSTHEMSFINYPRKLAVFATHLYIIFAKGSITEVDVADVGTVMPDGLQFEGIHKRSLAELRPTVDKMQDLDSKKKAHQSLQSITSAR